MTTHPALSPTDSIIESNGALIAATSPSGHGVRWFVRATNANRVLAGSAAQPDLDAGRVPYPADASQDERDAAGRIARAAAEQAFARLAAHRG